MNYINGHYYHDELINEEKIFGVRIDKNKLNDEKYVRQLIKEINKESKKNPNTFVDKVLTILTIISLLSIVGIPIGILLAHLTIEINNIEYDINTRDLKKIDNYLDKCIIKLKEAEANAEGKEKKEYQENIKKIEKNRQYIHDKINIEGSTKRKIYGEKLTDAEIKELYSLIKKDLTPILDKYNKSKKTEIRKAIDDYLDSIIGKEDNRSPEDIEFYKDDFGKYYSGGVPTLKCTEDYFANDNSFAITIFNVESRYLAESLNMVTESIAKEFKQKTKLTNIIEKVRSDYIGQLWITYDVLKAKEYLNSKSFKESYTFIEEKSNKYDPPYSKEDVLKKYGNDTYSKLSKDPAHRFRMDTGIELIHQEPSKEELIRIYNNWQLMPNSMKKKSDQKSIELFGQDNETHFKYLMDTVYKESYIIKRNKIKMNKINNLANIARQYGITESGNLRDNIVSEYTNILESLNTINESIINHDISLLPVYKINESTIEEGYAIDLDSLKYVIESKEITIEEAIQEIRDINYIGDTIPMYCVLPKDINEKMTLESFINLNDTLYKYNINPIAIKEYSEEEFIKVNKNETEN